MSDKYFKVFGRKVGNGKMILIAVVDDDFIGEVPEQFELQGFKPTPNIYTGTYPTLRLNTDTIKDVHEDFKGNSIDGVLTSNDWYCISKESKNTFGIDLP